MHKELIKEHRLMFFMINIKQVWRSEVKCQKIEIKLKKSIDHKFNQLIKCCIIY